MRPGWKKPGIRSRGHLVPVSSMSLSIPGPPCSKKPLPHVPTTMFCLTMALEPAGPRTTEWTATSDMVHQNSILPAGCFSPVSGTVMEGLTNACSILWFITALTDGIRSMPSSNKITILCSW